MNGHSIREVEQNGLHSDPGNKLKRASNLVIEKTRMGKCGAYEARVGLGGVFKAQNSTFFPHTWNEEKVVQKIFEAADNLITIGESKSGQLNLIGVTNEGLKINLEVSGKGFIKSAWPILE